MRVEKTVTESLTRLPYIDYFKKTAGRLMKQDMISPVVLSLDISNFKFGNNYSVKSIIKENSTKTTSNRV